MTTEKVVPIAVFSVLLAACGGSSSGGNVIRPDAPPAITPDPSAAPVPGSSLSQVPLEYRERVSSRKTLTFSGADEAGAFQFTIDGKSGEYNVSDLANGSSSLPVSVSYQGEKGPATATGTLHLYQQTYSVVMGASWVQDTGGGFIVAESDRGTLSVWDEDVLGLKTLPLALSELVKKDAIFTYKGVALDGKEQAILNYTMAFGDRMGHGSITGFVRTGLIELSPAELTNDGVIRGTAEIENASDAIPGYGYELSFFGPEAEEIVGFVYDEKEDGLLGGSEVIFGGEAVDTKFPGLDTN